MYFPIGMLVCTKSCINCHSFLSRSHLHRLKSTLPALARKSYCLALCLHLSPQASTLETSETYPEKPRRTVKYIYASLAKQCCTYKTSMLLWGKKEYKLRLNVEEEWRSRASAVLNSNSTLKFCSAYDKEVLNGGIRELRVGGVNPGLQSSPANTSHTEINETLSSRVCRQPVTNTVRGKPYYCLSPWNQNYNSIGTDGVNYFTANLFNRIIELRIFFHKISFCIFPATKITIRSILSFKKNTGFIQSLSLETLKASGLVKKG